jgi:DNA polymerase III epsilon subunit-like protein
MNKTLCIIHTETNGLHQINNDVSKKILYSFARLVKLDYIIGHMDNNNFVIDKKVEQIIKPRCCNISKEITEIHGISQSLAEQKGTDPLEVLTTFKNDIKKVDFIISHNVDFHLKTLIAEATRYNLNIDYNKYIIIDTFSFYHKYDYIRLVELAKKFKIKKTNIPTVELIKDVFFALYSEYSKEIKSKN